MQLGAFLVTKGTENMDLEKFSKRIKNHAVKNSTIHTSTESTVTLFDASENKNSNQTTRVIWHFW